MAFRRVGSLIAGAVPIAPPKDNKSFQLTDAEDAVAGRVFKADTSNAGQFTKASGTDGVGLFICLEDADGDTPGVSVRGEYIVPGMIYRADLSGVASLYVGQTGARLDANGDKVLDGTQTDGPITILSIDTDDETALVVFTKCAVAG